MSRDNIINSSVGKYNKRFIRDKNACGSTTENID